MHLLVLTNRMVILGQTGDPVFPPLLHLPVLRSQWKAFCLPSFLGIQLGARGQPANFLHAKLYPLNSSKFWSGSHCNMSKIRLGSKFSEYLIASFLGWLILDSSSAVGETGGTMSNAHNTFRGQWKYLFFPIRRKNELRLKKKILIL